MLINNSQDIFWIILSLAIFGLSVLLGMMMYYTIRIIRQTSRMVDRIGAILDTLSDLSRLIHGKIADLNSALSVIRRGSKAWESMTSKPKKKSKETNHDA